MPATLCSYIKYHHDQKTFFFWSVPSSCIYYAIVCIPWTEFNYHYVPVMDILYTLYKYTITMISSQQERDEVDRNFFELAL
jgi:hypothetical protein